MEADDAGWLRLSIPRIGSDIYPYLGRAAREKRVRDAIAELRERGRVEVHPCGHAFIPTLTRHQHPSKPVLTVQAEHAREQRPAEARGDPAMPTGTHGDAIPAEAHGDP